MPLLYHGVWFYSVAEIEKRVHRHLGTPDRCQWAIRHYHLEMPPFYTPCYTWEPLRHVAQQVIE